MKRKSRIIIVVFALFLSSLPSNLGAEDLKIVRNVDSIDNYIKNLKPTTKKEFIKDTKGKLYYVSMEDSSENPTMTISSVENNTDKRKTFKYLRTNFVVYHNHYWDTVGKVHSSSNYYKKYTPTGQPYYVWGKCASGVYDHREDGFYVKHNYYTPKNTSLYKHKSYVQETGTWGSKYNTSKINERFYYAPANE